MTASFEEFKFRVALAATQWETLHEKAHEFRAWIQEAKDRLVIASAKPGPIKTWGGLPASLLTQPVSSSHAFEVQFDRS